MMEEERQRIESILNQNHLIHQSEAIKTDDALVVPTPTEAPYNSQSSQLKDPLLYPETLAPSLNSSPATLSHDSISQVNSKAPLLNGEHMGVAAAEPCSGQVQAKAERFPPLQSHHLKETDLPLPPIPTARRKKNKILGLTITSPPNDEDKQVPTRELQLPSWSI